MATKKKIKSMETWNVECLWPPRSSSPTRSAANTTWEIRKPTSGLSGQTATSQRRERQLPTLINPIQQKVCFEPFSTRWRPKRAWPHCFKSTRCISKMPRRRWRRVDWQWLLRGLDRSLQKGHTQQNQRLLQLQLLQLAVGNKWLQCHPQRGRKIQVDSTHLSSSSKDTAVCSGLLDIKLPWVRKLFDNNFLFLLIDNKTHIPQVDD